MSHFSLFVFSFFSFFFLISSNPQQSTPLNCRCGLIHKTHTRTHTKHKLPYLRHVVIMNDMHTLLTILNGMVFRVVFLMSINPSTMRWKKKKLLKVQLDFVDKYFIYTQAVNSASDRSKLPPWRHSAAQQRFISTSSSCFTLKYLLRCQQNTKKNNNNDKIYNWKKATLSQLMSSCATATTAGKRIRRVSHSCSFNLRGD